MTRSSGGTCAGCGEPEHSLEHSPYQGGNHAFQPQYRHVSIAGQALCGVSLSLTSSKFDVPWTARSLANCTRCSLLVTIADANNIEPATAQPSLRAALDKLLKAAL